ncbi:MAG TPA: superoxide dismutase family protein [Myxococcales bacterium]|nr:superoxide dismutase family protein [Myxococcales bacterium]
MRSPIPILLACACSTTQSGPRTTNAAAAAVAAATGPAATAQIEPRSGSTLTGTARFVEVSDGLGIHVELKGAPPGPHGIHVHEKGDCSDPGAASAGGHYNPTTAAHHGGPATAVRHGGDLGNIEVDQNGNGVLDVVVPDLSVASVQNGVVGRAIVVHAGADDLHSDPAGNSGARIGCGTILAPPNQPSL